MGSTRESLLDVGQNALDRVPDARRAEKWIFHQLCPLRSQSVQTEFDCNAQQQPKPRPHERSPDAHGIIGIRIGPNQSWVPTPKLLVERCHLA